MIFYLKKVLANSNNKDYNQCMKGKALIFPLSVWRCVHLG